MRVNFDVEFFYGDNEEALLATKLNTLNQEQKNQFKEILNDYLNSPGWGPSCWPTHRQIADIQIDGPITILTFADNSTIEISSEMTFKNILNKLIDDLGTFFKQTLNDIEELPDFICKLNKYLEDKEITSIVLDGCDDAIVHLKGGESFDICSETTANDILSIIMGLMSFSARFGGAR